MLTIGDPVPWFSVRASGGANFRLSRAAGPWLVLSVIGSAGQDGANAMLEAIRAETGLFDGIHADFYAVSCDAEDEMQNRIADHPPGFHVLWDTGIHIPEIFGLKIAQGGQATIRCATFVLDGLLRVAAILPMTDIRTHAAQVIACVAKLPRPESPAPVLIVPRVFEPEFCKLLIAYYGREKSIDSGFVVTDPQSGKTVLQLDHTVKRRRDVMIEDEKLRQQIGVRLARRLLPEVKKIFQFDATRVERFIVACYDGEDGGFFRAHRDNTTKGTAHRRFAVTLNLNAEDYEGGDLRFPEFGAQTYRAPTGGAVVFSCSLLHEATEVTRGTRYVFLPFLYDEAGTKIREENAKFVGDPEEAAQ